MADLEAELLAGGDENGHGGEDALDEDVLLAEDNSANNDNSVKEEELDLFDAAIEPTTENGNTSLLGSQTSHPPTPAVVPNNAAPSLSSSSGTSIGSSGKKFCCYIGNMTWWTTDEDIQKTVNACGATDLHDLKFYENRTNGQSKGFCLAVFNSDQSVRVITEKLPLRPIHGQTLVVLPYSKMSLARLEEASAKTQTRNDPKKDDSGLMNMGTIRIGANGITPVAGAALMNAQPLMGGPIGMPPQMRGGPMGGGPMMGGMGGPMGGGPPMMGGGMMGRPPVQLIMQGGPPQQMGMQQQMRGPPPNMMGYGGPLMRQGPPMNMNQPPPGMSMNRPPPLVGPGAPQPLMGRPPGAGQPGFPSGAHINPNIYPGFQGGPDQGPPLSEGEAEEIMTRNRTISSSAISRAIADATSGDHAGAIDTLLTAISLIKQSKCAGDERCKLLISSLHDTLSGIEAKMKDRKRDRRERSRSRSRERKHRRRSRSRSRSRSPPRRKY